MRHPTRPTSVRRIARRLLAVAVTLAAWAAPAAPAFAATPTAATTTVTLAGAALAVDGSGAVADGTTLRIVAGGRYLLRGVLEGGEVVVDAGDADVELVLDGARIVSHRSAAVYVAAAGTTTITLAPGSANHLEDAAAYELADPASDEPEATIFAKDDLVIAGSGSLTVIGAFHNGIQGKDDVRIVGGTIAVEAMNHGVKGKDSLVVEGGTIAVTAGGDGLQASNADDPELGFVRIEGGTIAIDAGDDGIQAETVVTVLDGTLAIVAGGGTTAGEGTAKGIKGLAEVRIEGGTITVDAADDALHTHGAMVIAGGRLTLAAGDDAAHADGTLEIHGGDVDVTTSYEGLEAASIAVHGGEVAIVSRDDGINAVSATTAAAGAVAAAPGGRGPMRAPGGGMATGDAWLRIHGGTLVVFSGGDGVDANGSVEMTGGVVVIHGPTVNMEGALDYDRSFTITGGVLLAPGSAGMAQAPSAAGSTQATLAMNFAQAVAAGVPLRLERVDGGEIVTFVPQKAFQSLVVSSPALTVGETVVVWAGGTPTVAPASDGRVAGGDLVGATEVTRVTLSGVVTTLGSRSGGPGPRR